MDTPEYVSERLELIAEGMPHGWQLSSDVVSTVDGLLTTKLPGLCLLIFRHQDTNRVRLMTHGLSDPWPDALGISRLSGYGVEYAMELAGEDVEMFRIASGVLFGIARYLAHDSDLPTPVPGYWIPAELVPFELPFADLAVVRPLDQPYKCAGTSVIFYTAFVCGAFPGEARRVKELFSNPHDGAEAFGAALAELGGGLTTTLKREALSERDLLEQAAN